MVKIKSKTDVITNSSSEVFVIKTNETAKELFDRLYSLLTENDISSGDGGVLNINTKDDFYGNDFPYSMKNIPKGYARIRVDEGYRSIINYLIPINKSDVEETMILYGELLSSDEYFQRFKDINIVKDIFPDFENKIKNIKNNYQNNYQRLSICCKGLFQYLLLDHDHFYMQHEELCKHPYNPFLIQQRLNG